MKKKKLKKKLRKLESRIHKMENPVHEVREIGFKQLSNLHQDNEYDYED